MNTPAQVHYQAQGEAPSAFMWFSIKDQEKNCDQT